MKERSKKHRNTKIKTKDLPSFLDRTGANYLKWVCKSYFASWFEQMEKAFDRRKNEERLILMAGRWANHGRMEVNLDIETYAMDTVVMEFSENDLISARGTFVDCFGEEQDYLYILENPQNIRLTTLEEPTFGWQIPICRVVYETKHENFRSISLLLFLCFMR